MVSNFFLGLTSATLLFCCRLDRERHRLKVDFELRVLFLRLIILASCCAALLQEEADFLVRESMDDPRQNILTVLQNGNAKHIQLVDPAGRVRTQDMMFNGVSHLINYHLVQRAPINFRTGQVKLDYPVENQGAGTQNYGGSVYGE